MSVLITGLAALILPGEAFFGRGAGTAAATLVASASGVTGAASTDIGGTGSNAMLRVEKGGASTRDARCVARSALEVPSKTNRCAATTAAVSRPSIEVGITVDLAGAGAGFIQQNFASLRFVE